MDQNQGKGQQDFTLTAPAKIVKRPKPVPGQLGNRIVSSDGHFHSSLAADYILDHGGKERQIPTGELARVFFGGNTPSNKKRIRQRLYLVFNEFLGRGFLLVIDIDPRKGAQSCKLYDPRSTEERQSLHARLERMQKLRMMKTAQYNKAVELAQSLDEGQA